MRDSEEPHIFPFQILEPPNLIFNSRVKRNCCSISMTRDRTIYGISKIKFKQDGIPRATNEIMASFPIILSQRFINYEVLNPKRC